MIGRGEVLSRLNKVPTLLDVHSEAILLDQPYLPRVESVIISWDLHPS